LENIFHLNQRANTKIILLIVDSKFVYFYKNIFFISDTSQVLGRHLGRRTFRKLDFSNRGFVTIGQMFRITSSDHLLSDNLNSDEIRARKGSKFERKITETELSAAGMSFVEGELPNESLNSEFNQFRCRFEHNSVFGFDSLICSKNEISSSKSFWIMTIFALIAALINISPKLVFVFGLFCQTLFELLFGPAIDRQFDLWSKFWTGACKLSEQKVFESKQTFLRKRNISNSVRIFVTISLLQLYPTANEPLICYQLLFASSLFTILTVLRKLNKFKVFAIAVILLPQLVPLAMKEFRIKSSTFKIPDISNQYLLPFNRYASAIFIGICSTLSNDSNFLLIISFSTIFHCALKCNVQTWILVFAFGLFIGTLKNKFVRIRTFLVVGLFVGLLFHFGENGIQFQFANKTSTPIAGLTWSKFNQICPKNCDISTKIDCSYFVGRTVAWEGRVTDISLERKSTQNIKSFILSLFPNVVKQFVPLKPFSKGRESFCRLVKSDFKLPCDNWSNFDDFRCKVSIEMSRSLFSGDGQKVFGIVNAIEDCLKIKIGSYLQFVATIEEVVEENRIEIQSIKHL
jgi:hypothetical protein